MKYLLIISIIFISPTTLDAQKHSDKYVSIALFNTQNARPFGKFAGLFNEVLHPGIEVGYGKNFSVHNNHEWFSELKLAYFYHRFVQHGVPLYLDFGYRCKVKNYFSVESSIGAGYMQSIPATAQLKLNSDGEYVKAKGIGRSQLTASFAIGLQYKINPLASKPLSVFAAYQQRVQMPFVKSYVPLLPYNNFLLGISRPIGKTNKK